MGGGNGNGEETENADWWIGTWRSIEYKQDELSITYYFEIKLEGNDTDYSSGSCVLWVKDTDGNIRDWDTGEITDKDYSIKSTWKLDEYNGNYDGISFKDKEPFEYIYIDSDRKQLYFEDLNDNNEIIKEYFTKL